MSKSFGKTFFWENKWGIILGIVVAVFGGITNYFLSSLQFVSYILQAVALFLITAMLSNYLSNRQRETIEINTDIALGKIENKYKGISCNSMHLFKIFHLNDGGSFYNVAHNIFFNNIIKSYYSNGENRKYCISIDIYYQIIQDFLSKGYKMKTINGLLLPFWYVPKEKNKALTEYTEFCKKEAELFERITYYQDYENDNWKDNTVRMIYYDLLSSEKSTDFAVRWLITLIVKIKTLRNTFSKDIEKILSIQLEEHINYLQYDKVEFISIIKNNIKNITAFLENKDSGIENSRKMTSIINDLFYNDMKKRNKFVARSIIVAMFEKDVINFEDVTAVCCFYKEGSTDDQFVMLLNGSNTGPSVEIEIITKEDRIIKIQQIITDLLKP